MEQQLNNQVNQRAQTYCNRRKLINIILCLVWMGAIFCMDGLMTDKFIISLIPFLTIIFWLCAVPTYSDRIKAINDIFNR